MTEDEIVEYVTHTPENTNPAVLRSMLQQYNNGSGGNGTLIVNELLDESSQTTILDKNWNEIKTAFDNGQVAIIKYSNNTALSGIGYLKDVYSIFDRSQEYYVDFMTLNKFASAAGIINSYFSATSDGILEYVDSISNNPSDT